MQSDHQIFRKSDYLSHLWTEFQSSYIREGLQKKYGPFGLATTHPLPKALGSQPLALQAHGHLCLWHSCLGPLGPTPGKMMNVLMHMQKW